MNSAISITLTREKLPPVAIHPVLGAGAVVTFSGIIRPEEAGVPIAAIDYEGYDSMAEKELHRIISSLQAEYPCLAVRVVHRLGVVPAGDAALYVEAHAPHRREALGMVEALMNELKQRVPIWKIRTIPLAQG